MNEPVEIPALLPILPEMVLGDVDPRTGPVAVRLQSPKMSRSLVLARRRDRYFSAAAQEFMRVLHGVAQRQ